MASPEAQAFFNKQSPADQEAIRASWGGKDQMDAWYQAAKAAGSVPAESTNWRGTYSGTGEHNGYDANYGAKKLPKPGANATPDEIRKYAWDQGWGSDDLAEYDDATIAQWIKDGKWDPQAGKFRNDYGDLVEKPGEDGPQSAGRQALFNSGRYASPNEVPSQAGAGGGGGAKPTANAESSGNPLQDALVRSFQNREGQFVNAGVQGAELGGGGVFWSDPTAVNPAAPQTGGADPRSGAAVGTGAANANSGYNPAATGPGNAALVGATLNAFTPNAVSANMSQPGGAQPAPQSTSNQWTGGAQPGTLGLPKWEQDDAQELSPLSRKLSNQFARQSGAPQEWWRAQ